jgi:hypothetical protein
MVIMEHPNGCVHNVRDDLVDRFTAAGWKVKAAPSEPPIPEEPKKRKTRSKK